MSGSRTGNVGSQKAEVSLRLVEKRGEEIFESDLGG